jgi:hypothetical protein
MVWRFPDAEAALMDLIVTVAPSATIATILDTGWEKNLPQIQVNRIGGSADDVTDTARLQVAVYHKTRALTWALASSIRELVLESANEAPGGVLIDSASEVIAGQQVPDIDPDDRRVISTYQLSFRRQNLP